jgi:hypothetical protein
MGTKRPYLRTAAQLLALAALGWAWRKASRVPPARLQSLRNRLVLSLNFFRATDVTGMIHKAEFGFIYLDGDRSAHAKQVSGLWSHDADQPDVLCPIPHAWQIPSGGLFLPYDSTGRRAMILARADRRRDLPKRTRAQILDVLLAKRVPDADPEPTEPRVSGWAAATWEDRAEEAYLRAFARYPMWPSFPSLWSLPPEEN